MIRDEEGMYVSTPCIMAEAISDFGPHGFYSMMARRARENHPVHDRFYDGGLEQTIDTPNGSVVRALSLPALAKRQFEPILANDLKPLTIAEQDPRLHMKKHSCKYKN